MCLSLVVSTSFISHSALCLPHIFCDCPSCLSLTRLSVCLSLVCIWVCLSSLSLACLPLFPVSFIRLSVSVFLVCLSPVCLSVFFAIVYLRLCPFVCLSRMSLSECLSVSISNLSLLSVSLSLVLYVSLYFCVHLHFCQIEQNDRNKFKETTRRGTETDVEKQRYYDRCTETDMGDRWRLKHRQRGRIRHRQKDRHRQKKGKANSER